MKPKYIFTGLLLVYCYFNLVGRAHGFYFNFIAIGIVNFFVFYRLLKVNPFKFFGWIFMAIPFLLLTSNLIYTLINNSVFVSATLDYFMFLFSSLSGLLLYLFKESNNKPIIIGVYLLLYIGLIGNYSNIYNYTYDGLYPSPILGASIKNLELKDETGKVFIFPENKLLVIDLWSNSCGVCIQEFPKFQKIFNHFENNPDIEVFSINILNSDRDVNYANKYLENYSFDNFFVDSSIYEQLKFNSIPYYMVVNKDGVIKYFGYLNTQINETYNNIYKIIENERL